jgi:hypothetical protein
LVQPENARKLQLPSLSAFFKRFPVQKEKCNIVEAEAEWRRQSNLSVILEFLLVKKSTK